MLNVNYLFPDSLSLESFVKKKVRKTILRTDFGEVIRNKTSGNRLKIKETVEALRRAAPQH